MTIETEEIGANTPALIKHIADNYDARRPPELVEPIQNSQDEFARYLAEEKLDESRQLRIQFRVNVDEGYAEITDNAGGIPRDVMDEVVPEIDTTSEAKARGTGVGSKGRGLFAVAAKTEKMYIETLNLDGERLSKIVYPSRGRVSKTLNPSDVADDEDEDVINSAPLLSGPEGTVLRLHGLNAEALHNLSDWETVEETLTELFTPLFSRPDVTLEYIIEEDGKVTTHTLDVTPLEDLIEERVETIDSHEFEIYDETYEITDVVFGRAAQSYPWEGIALFKGNEHFDGPVMMVDSYSPKIRSLKGSNPEMIAWCRIDNCAELEDSSHQKLKIRNRQTGLRTPAQEVHIEHFAEGSASEEQEINRLLRDTVNQAVDGLDNHQFEEFFNLQQQGELSTEDTQGSEDELRSENGSLLTLNPTEYPAEVGEVTTEVRVYPPKTPECDEYVIYDIDIRGDVAGIPEIDATGVVEATPDEVQTAQFSWEAPEPGWYQLEASIAAVPADEDPETWTPTHDDEIDSSFLNQPVGVDPRGEGTPKANGEGGSGPGDGDNDGDGDGDGDGDTNTVEESASIFNKINELGHDGSKIFADAYLDDGGGFTVNINKAHPKWREIYEQASSDEERKTRHQEFGAKKIARAMIEELKFVRLEQAADGTADIDALLDEAYDIREDHEEIYAELEQNVEGIVS
ncbi:hypothetical protein [Halobaculum limi]|uniref:hypothetical protein n=1 Tax=Halobaculum limi TaxID=3031916 RepID=UPI0024059871|nr:hypothetical protein [Halobaculum sp. YSMS11]